MSIRGECYSGYRGEQEPLAFWPGQRRLTVLAVADRWFAPGQRWFKVDVDDGNVYVLRRDEVNGNWEIAAYRDGLPDHDAIQEMDKSLSKQGELSWGSLTCEVRGTWRVEPV